MVYKYQRKTNQQMWDKEQMHATLRAVKEGAKINAAARAHNVPVATLFRRLKKPIKEGAMKGLGQFRPVFSSDQENILVEYLLQMEARLFDLTRSDLSHLAFHYAELNQITHSFNKIDQKAGRD
ncbi:homeobox-like domain superfamily [Holotrichia oblita]|uniref:Homeobox-like domain superfamily n=1 Tax=Holotrichia oblita TaxID=644536 RepID=A0ACB9SK85_HOLOL|nr:homeobox-like domain superfamily [Holotrichia oblita]